MNDEHEQDNSMPDAVPLEPWLIAAARDATDVESSAIPRDMMWQRIANARSKQQRASQVTEAHAQLRDTQMLPTPRSVIATGAPRDNSRQWMSRAAGIAALLVGGIGVGRYLMPATGPSKYQTAIAQIASRSDSITALGLGPEAIAALPPSADPAHVAMEEHLMHTVSLLTSVRDDDARGSAGDLPDQARNLLRTTRLLLDEPQLRDQRTQRLLQDLELVLVQIIQARASAPETKRAPGETIRETNLLPRVRAATTASRRGEDLLSGGGL